MCYFCHYSCSLGRASRLTPAQTVVKRATIPDALKLEDNAGGPSDQSVESLQRGPSDKRCV